MTGIRSGITLKILRFFRGTKMIECYIEDIRECLKNKCYFAALSLTLTLPDICGMIEYPKESSVAKRYINWYDKYIGERLKKQRFAENESYISGEIIYNLRNQFLHQGNPNINSGKVKEEVNQIDNFILEVGDAATFYEECVVFEFGKVSFRGIIINITYLCESICSNAELYHCNNKDRFKDKFPLTFKDGYNNQGYTIINQNALPMSDAVYSKLQECDEEFKKLKISKEQFKKQFEAGITNMLVNMVADFSQQQKSLIKDIPEGQENTE